MINRRQFLSQSLATVSLGLTVPSVFSKAIVAAAAETQSLSVSGKALIVIQLAGGYDGLNMVIPYQDPAYRSLRDTLGIPESDMIAVDDRVAFHPAMSTMKGLLDEGRLAVIEGAGYPNPNYSHFKAMDIWQTGDLDGQAHDGWLGRYFDGLTDGGGHPLSGVSVGRRLPTAFNASGAPIPAVESVETFALENATGDLTADQRRTSLLQLYDLYRPANTPFAALLDSTLDSAFRSSIELAAAHEAYEPAVSYPQSSLASGLRLLAELIDSGEDGTPLRVGHVTLGGFDTHAQQDTRFGDLLSQANAAIGAFQQDIDAHGHGDDVLTMVWTEFGRRPQENAQSGTDHGSAVPMFLIGNSVNGGFHGEPPSLTSLDNGNLRFTTDFRSVYATVIEAWLQASSADILGAQFPQLDLLRSQ